MDVETRCGSEFFVTLYPCHPDRSAGGMPTFHELIGAEWRDPEGVSSAMPHQGVLTRLTVVTGRRPKRKVLPAMGPISLLAYPACSEQQTCKRDDAREELPVSVSPGIACRDPSTPRQRFLIEPRSSWRCGRDDSLNGFSRRMVVSSPKPLASTACRQENAPQEIRGAG
jgi:hypothetical protein